MAPQKHEANNPGGADDDAGTRRMFDKRTLRKMFKQYFISAIESYRADESRMAKALPPLPPSGTAVYVRKRPMFANEEEEFDCVTSLVKGTVLHDCKLKADLKSPYVVHRTFPVTCFSAAMTNNDVCQGINLLRLVQRAVEGEHVTCCMFGQTGSGKSHTMTGILQRAADILFQEHEIRRPNQLQAILTCFEVCGSNCFDLLDGGEKLIIREISNTKVEVAAKQVEVASADVFLQQLHSASHNRSTSSTLRNLDSSRSHAFYRLTLFCEEPISRANSGGHARSNSIVATVGPSVQHTSAAIRHSSAASAKDTTSLLQTPTPASKTPIPAPTVAIPTPIPPGSAAGRPIRAAASPGSSSKGLTGPSRGSTSSASTKAPGSRPTVSIPRGSSGTGASSLSPGVRKPPSTTAARSSSSSNAAANRSPGSAVRSGLTGSAGSSLLGKASARSTASRPPFDSSPVQRAGSASRGGLAVSLRPEGGRTSSATSRRLALSQQGTGKGSAGRHGQMSHATPVTKEADEVAPTSSTQEAGAAEESVSTQAEHAEADGAERPGPVPEVPVLEEQPCSPAVAVQGSSTVPGTAEGGGSTTESLVALRKAQQHADRAATEQLKQVASDAASAAASAGVDEAAAHKRTPSGSVLMLSRARQPSISQDTPLPVPTQRVERGTITFVDLAGSERAWDSMYHNAEQRKQTADINASLACLKECFRLRSQQMQRGGPLRVPYRDSRLTLLLRDSLQNTNSREPCVVVVATLSPCAGDTEHTLNTLRNAITMTGLDINHTNKGELAEEEDILVDLGADKVVKHPSRWEVEEVREWMSAVADGKYATAATNLTSATDGKALMRFAPVRFKLLCNGNQKQGDELYRLFKAELHKANESKSQYQDGIRTLASGAKVF